MDPRKILILTADAGFGHRSTAVALARAFALRYGDGAAVTIANPLDDPKALSLLRRTESDYDKLASEWPEFYELGYRMSDLAITTSATEMAYVVLTFDLISTLMRAHQPDVVVVTFPTYQAPIDMFRRINGDETPMATVITDLVSLQRMWFYKNVDLCLAPTDIAAGLAVKNDVPAERVHVTGLPVNPALADAPASKAEARRALGWDPALFTLLAVGSKRVEGLERFTDMLNHAGFPLQLIAVAGGDDELFKIWEETEWHIPVQCYNFVRNMPDMLHAADAVLSKAGGLIVTESLACGLPLLLMQVIPGQETGNAQLVTREGAGDLTLQPPELLEALAHWFAEDGRLYRERAANARRLGRPNAATDAAELIWELAETGMAPRPARRSVSVESVKELLRQFDVRLS